MYDAEKIESFLKVLAFMSSGFISLLINCIFFGAYLLMSGNPMTLGILLVFFTTTFLMTLVIFKIQRIV